MFFFDLNLFSSKDDVETTDSDEYLGLLEPVWDCEEAIEDFLEKGRRLQKDDNSYLVSMPRTCRGFVTKAEVDYYVIDHKFQFNRRDISLKVDETPELNVGNFVSYTLQEGRCIHILLIDREKENGDDNAWLDDEVATSKENEFLSSLVKIHGKTTDVDELVSVNAHVVAVRQATGYGRQRELVVDIGKDQKKFSFSLDGISIGGPVNKSGDTSTNAFVPIEGDWIRLIASRVETDSKVADSETSFGKVIALEPLRWRNFEGEVTRISFESRRRNEEFAIVECEIFIPIQTCCLSGYRPTRGDWVAGLAFESSARESCSWRAVGVYPRPNSRNKPRMANQDQATTSEKTNEPPPDESSVNKLPHIEVTGDIHFGPVTVGDKDGKDDIISITNIGEKVERLLSVQLGDSPVHDANTDARMTSAFKLSFQNLTLPMEIGPKQRVDVSVICQPKQVGLENEKIRLVFADSDGGEEIVLSTYVEVDAVVPEMESGLSAPMLDNQRVQQLRAARVAAVNSFRNDNTPFTVPCPKRPVSNSKPRETFVARLNGYEMPHKLRSCLESRDDVVVVCPFLSEDICLDNYVKRFSALLHLEEFAIQKELDLYSLSRVFFKPSSLYLGLDVPGLSEGRPSLLVGDRVIATDPSPNSNSPAFEGLISEVRFSDVLVSFDPNFHSSYNGKDYNVSFKFNRTPFRRCHQAIELACNRFGQQILFPDSKSVDGRCLKEPQQKVAMKTHTIGSNSLRRYPKIDKIAVNPCDYVPRLNLKFFNPILNDRQRMAVLRIVEGLARPVPYILYGPPGTGKTVTLVEVLLQLYHQLPNSRILACAPSNSAADLLCTRLHLLNRAGKGENEPGLDMVRLNAANRSDLAMDDAIIKQYSKSLDDIDVAVKSRIVISTCTTAGQMYTANVKAGSFTHVVVDEAGHATEPEVLIPVNFADCRNGQIILAGDPQQLGPILESRFSNNFGLQLSFLERLSKLPVYCRNEQRFSRVGIAGGYNPLVATKLVNNYRSHPSLFNVSSRLFYDDELVANAPLPVQNLFIDACCTRNSKLLLNPTMPFILRTVKGHDRREGESMSWFNMAEVMEVVDYTKQLMEDFSDVITVEDIGIITPYRKQIEKIRLMFDLADLPPVKVGTVEEFQGQERSVIILSLVRSSETACVRQALGFLSNPKRMNVALTRAKSLLIVVANPMVLLLDPYWAEFAKYALQNNCCVGTGAILTELHNKLGASTKNN